jgi:Tfp pilus assembly protein PilF
MNPENPSVLNNYAYYLSVRGVRLADAEKMSKKSLEIRPGEATFLDTYGWIFYKEGDYQDAKKFIEDAIKADKDADGTVWEHLGDVMYKLNDVDKAVDCWKKAKEKGTDSKKIDKKIQDRKLYE